jgi:hypothetical protein
MQREQWSSGGKKYFSGSKTLYKLWTHTKVWNLVYNLEIVVSEISNLHFMIHSPFTFDHGQNCAISKLIAHYSISEEPTLILNNFALHGAIYK